MVFCCLPMLGGITCRDPGGFGPKLGTLAKNLEIEPFQLKDHPYTQIVLHECCFTFLPTLSGIALFSIETKALQGTGLHGQFVLTPRTNEFMSDQIVRHNCEDGTTLLPGSIRHIPLGPSEGPSGTRRVAAFRCKNGPRRVRTRHRWFWKVRGWVRDPSGSQANHQEPGSGTVPVPNIRWV